MCQFIKLSLSLLLMILTIALIWASVAGCRHVDNLIDKLADHIQELDD